MTATIKPDNAAASYTVAFIGGGNMAQAIIGGLLRRGWPTAKLLVVEPCAAARAQLAALGLTALPHASPALALAEVVLWAVKPQAFAHAAAPVRAHTAAHAVHLSIMAGIACSTLQRHTGSARLVRSMPNTPALVGMGMVGLYGAPDLSAHQRSVVEAILAPTGDLQWFAAEDDLDAVTALSGSGPAYVFYFLEALVSAGCQLGLSAQSSRRLAVQTFRGASELAAQSTEALATLRARVTSKGGTTDAAIARMQSGAVQQNIAAAVLSAHARARELAQAPSTQHPASHQCEPER